MTPYKEIPSTRIELTETPEIVTKSDNFGKSM